MKVLPYSNNNIFSREYPYEGFHNLEYSTNDTNKTNDSYQSFLINSSSNNECKKVYGFDGLFCKPYVADRKIDPLEILDTTNCRETSSGFSNSKGNLCFNDNQKKLLSTRGGNATGSPSVIG
jgi:hypothetical protein